MMMDESKTVPEVTFPVIPDSVDDELRDYLIERDKVLIKALQGSLFLERMFADGIFGN